MPELQAAQRHLARALGYLAPTNPHPVCDVVRAQLPALCERIQRLIVDVGFLREAQESGAPLGEE